ncbi:MAG: peptidoglycan-binding protein, partial [Sneathiella sp.]|nr:peptidoglycan-binding protein [Sneathiella sp.]
MTIFKRHKNRTELLAVSSAILMLFITTIPVAAKQLESLQFQYIAEDLMEGLNNTRLGAVKSSAGYNAPKVAVRCVDSEEDLSKNELKVINSYFIASLHKISGSNFYFIDRSNLKDLVEERDRYGTVASKVDDLNNLLENNRADILIICRLSKEDRTVYLSYQAVATETGQVLVSAAPRALTYKQNRDIIEIAQRSSSIQQQPSTGSHKYRSTVERAENRLYVLGYEPGVADGYLTNETRRALREYQADSALRVNGRLTR